MVINYNLTAEDQAYALKETFGKCIQNHERTHNTDNLDATTFTDVERIVLHVVYIMESSGLNVKYWNEVRKFIENN